MRWASCSSSPSRACACSPARTRGAAISKIIQNQIRLPSENRSRARDLRFDRAPGHGGQPGRIAIRARWRWPSISRRSAVRRRRRPRSGPWLQRLAGEILDQRARIVAEIERSSTRSKPPLPMPDSGVMRLPTPQQAAFPDADRGGSDVEAPPPRRTLTVASIALLSALLVACITVIVILVNRGGPTASPLPWRAPIRSPPRRSSARPWWCDRGRPKRQRSRRSPPRDAPVTAASVRRPVATATASATATAPPPPPVRPAGRVNCDPPYVVDKNGHQHFIPECMK